MFFIKFRSVQPIWFGIALLFLSANSFDNHYDYDTDLLSADFHKNRRDALRQLMPDSSVAVFFSNPLCVRSNDVDFDFHQNVNLYYLTGLREANSMLILFKEKQQIESAFTNEILVVMDRNPKKRFGQAVDWALKVRKQLYK